MRSEPLDYIQLTQDKVQCLVLFNTVVNPSVYITIEFLHQLSDYMHPSIYLWANSLAYYHFTWFMVIAFKHNFIFLKFVETRNM
jgi:hypothetical protein